MPGFEALSDMPDSLTSGDKVALRLATLSSAYPVGDFTLELIVKRGLAPAIRVQLADMDGVHGGALDLANASAGQHSWVIRATSGETSLSVASGFLTVMPDPATHDPRGHAERTLEAIEALIENKTVKDVSSYAIAGRSLTKMTPAELMEWRTYYRNEVARLRAAARSTRGRRITLASFR